MGTWLVWLLGVVTSASSQPEVPARSLKLAPDCCSFPANVWNKFHSKGMCRISSKSNIIDTGNLPCGTIARAKALLSSISAAFGFISLRPWTKKRQKTTWIAELHKIGIRENMKYLCITYQKISVIRWYQRGRFNYLFLRLGFFLFLRFLLNFFFLFFRLWRRRRFFRFLRLLVCLLVFLYSEQNYQKLGRNYGNLLFSFTFYVKFWDRKRNYGNYLTSLLLTEPDCGASFIYSSIVARKDGGGCLGQRRKFVRDNVVEST